MKKTVINIIAGAISINITPHGEFRSRKSKKYKPHTSDQAALAADWEAIGGDFKKALTKIIHAEA